MNEFEKARKEILKKEYEENAEVIKFMFDLIDSKEQGNE